ncbi:hypothetical protein CR513_32240, partial [Mucuna pruriens]
MDPYGHTRYRPRFPMLLFVYLLGGLPGAGYARCGVPTLVHPTYELKSGLIHLLPKFHGLVGEDLHKHLKEFHVVCSTMRPQVSGEVLSGIMNYDHQERNLWDKTTFWRDST